MSFSRKKKWQKVKMNENTTKKDEVNKNKKRAYFDWQSNLGRANKAI